MDIAITKKNIDGRYLLLAILSLITLYLIYSYITVSHSWDDWNTYFRPAAIDLLEGRSPYGTGFYNAPWALLILLPFSLLPPAIGRFLFCLASIAGFLYIARRLSSKPISIALFMTSAPVIFCIDGGNIDFLAMLSFITPAPFALILAAIKPQIGVGIGLYWLCQSWREGGIRLVIRNFLPVSLLLVASFIFFGPWILSVSPLRSIYWNISPFPWMIGVGIFLIVTSIRKSEARLAMGSGIFLSPYFTLLTLSSLLLPLLERPKLLAIAWAVLWVGVAVLIIGRG